MNFIQTLVIDTLSFYTILMYNSIHWRIVEAIIIFVFILLNNFYTAFLIKEQGITDFTVWLSLVISIYLIVSYIFSYRFHMWYTRSENPNLFLRLFVPNFSMYFEYIYYLVLSLETRETTQHRHLSGRRFVLLSFIILNLYITAFFSAILNFALIIKFKDFSWSYLIFIFAFLLICFPFYIFLYSLFLNTVYPQFRVRFFERIDYIRDFGSDFSPRRIYVYVPEYIRNYISGNFLNLILYRIKHSSMDLIVSQSPQYRNIHMIIMFVLITILVSFFLLTISLFFDFLNIEFHNLSSEDKSFVEKKRYLLFSGVSFITSIWFVLIVRVLVKMLPSSSYSMIKNIFFPFIYRIRIFYHDGRNIFEILTSDIFRLENPLYERDVYTFVFNVMIVIALTILFTVIASII